MKKYTEWSEYRKTLLSPEELEIIDAKVKLICEIIDAREKQGITQQELSEASSVKQPVIARLEKNRTNPQLETIIKLLKPLGLELTVRPIKSLKESA